MRNAVAHTQSSGQVEGRFLHALKHAPLLLRSDRQPLAHSLPEMEKAAPGTQVANLETIFT
jgi:hypothetical protein